MTDAQRETADTTARTELVRRTVLDVYDAIGSGDCARAAAVLRSLRRSGDRTAMSWVSSLLGELLPGRPITV